MAGILRIVCGVVQTRTMPFACRVYITGGAPGDTVTIRLWQTAGLDPPYHQVADAQLDGSGDGTAHFDVVLEGPCKAVLVSDDDASLVPLVSDSITIKVVP